MGLDISIATDNFEGVYSPEYYDPTNDYFNQHRLSRTFCNLMCRKDIVEHKPELDQIGEIAGVDITPLYEMEKYLEDEGLQFFLSVATTEEEKNKIIEETEYNRKKVEGNINLILKTVNELIDTLGKTIGIQDRLLQTDEDTLDNDFYFSEFNVDKEDDRIGHNFGQDLRNFRRFLEYAKSKGAKTVWFHYG